MVRDHRRQRLSLLLPGGPRRATNAAATSAFAVLLAGPLASFGFAAAQDIIAKERTDDVMSWRTADAMEELFSDDPMNETTLDDMNETMDEVRHRCTVTLYSDCFSGREASLHEGDYRLDDYGLAYQASSLRVQGTGCKAVLHPHYEGDGQPWYFAEGNHDCDKFGAIAQHDGASFIRVFVHLPSCISVPKSFARRFNATLCRQHSVPTMPHQPN